MGVPAILDGYRVLLSDDSPVRLELFEQWLPGIDTVSAAELEDVIAGFDAETIVACLSRPLLEEHESEIRKHIVTRNPFCQLVLLLPHGAPMDFSQDEYDACLQRPIHREEFQSTIETQLKLGAYSDTLHEFYALNAELSSFGHSDSQAGTGYPEEKLERYTHLKEQLDTLQGMIDSTDLSAVVQSLKLHNQYLTEPAENPRQTKDSKYHPDRCPSCKLPWGVDHRNNLGTGLERVGAHVWRCTRCHNIAHGKGSSHRQVLR